MSDVGQNEKATQNRIVKLISNKLGYKYLGDWQDRANNQNIEKEQKILEIIKQLFIS